MQAVQFIEQQGQFAEQVLQTPAGQYQFCRFCELENDCDHEGSKVTERSAFVLRYLYEFDAGITIYPLPGSWELQPHWFITMFNAGRSEMNKIRKAKQDEEMRKAQVRH